MEIVPGPDPEFPVEFRVSTDLQRQGERTITRLHLGLFGIILLITFLVSGGFDFLLFHELAIRLATVLLGAMLVSKFMKKVVSGGKEIRHMVYSDRIVMFFGEAQETLLFEEVGSAEKKHTPSYNKKYFGAPPYVIIVRKKDGQEITFMNLERMDLVWDLIKTRIPGEVKETPDTSRFFSAVVLPGGIGLLFAGFLIALKDFDKDVQLLVIMGGFLVYGLFALHTYYSHGKRPSERHSLGAGIFFTGFSLIALTAYLAGLF